MSSSPPAAEDRPEPGPGPGPGVALGLAFGAAALAGGFAGPAARAPGALLLTAVFLGVPLWPRGDPPPPLAEVGLPRPRLGHVAPGLAACLLLAPFHMLVKAGYWAVPPPGLRDAGAGALALFALRHLFDVVLPEELFFRGYLQPALAAPGEDRSRPLGRAVWLQALAFGLLHVVSFGGVPAAFDRAVPGLVFGALRARTGTVYAPAVFHLACNLYFTAGPR